jgi:hypothetical protein
MRLKDEPRDADCVPNRESLDVVVSVGSIQQKDDGAAGMERASKRFLHDTSERGERSREPRHANGAGIEGPRERACGGV